MYFANAFNAQVSNMYKKTANSSEECFTGTFVFLKRFRKVRTSVRSMS